MGKREASPKSEARKQRVAWLETVKRITTQTERKQHLGEKRNRTYRNTTKNEDYNLNTSPHINRTRAKKKQKQGHKTLREQENGEKTQAEP